MFATTKLIHFIPNGDGFTLYLFKCFLMQRGLHYMSTAKNIYNCVPLSENPTCLHFLKTHLLFLRSLGLKTNGVHSEVHDLLME